MSDTKDPTVADGVNVAHADDTKEEKAPEKVATIRELFMFSDWIDYLYIFLGTLGAVVTGLCIPTFNILFGKVINTVNRDPSGFQDTVNFLCIILVVVSGINLFSGFFQVYFWTAAGERLTQKYREKYVNAVLSQEIGWFDTCGANELSTKVSEYIGKIQDGTGRKIGDLIQNTVQICACLGVAFYFQWKIACVLLCSIPAIGIAGAFMIKATTSASNQALEQYASAGGLASESLNAIRTVSALNMQPDIITTYRVFLFKAMNVGIVKGLKVGAGNGLVFGVSFLTYALGFWYGGVLVARDLESDCTDNCTTGGVVITTFFATLMGSFALGQLTPSISALSEARAAAANVLEFYGVAQVGERIAATIRSDLFEALMRKNIGFFDREENNVGALTTNLSEDSRIINKAFGEAIAHQLQAFATLLVALGLGLSASWKIGLIVIACFPLTILSGMVRMRAFAGQQYDNEFEDTPQNSAQQAKANTKSGELNFLKLMIAMMTLMLGAIGIGNAMNDMGDQQIALEVATKIFATIDATTSPGRWKRTSPWPVPRKRPRRC
eukprot:gene1046-756_t